MQKEKYVTPLSVEEIDQLRSERQSVHPAIHTFAEDLLVKVNAEFVDQYSDLLDERPLQRNANVSERVVIGDDIGYDFNAWNRPVAMKDSLVTGDQFDGHTSLDHGIIYLMDPIAAWKSLSPDFQKFYEEMYGENAVSEFVNMYLSQTIIHEVTHLYQPRRCSVAVSEMTARLVEVELTDRLESGFIRSGLDEFLISGCEFLIDEFGEETVLRHSFGTLYDFSLSHQIDRASREYLVEGF